MPQPSTTPDSAPTAPADDPQAVAAPGRMVTYHLARLVLAAFVSTFMLSRILVILIMSKTIPDLFLHVGATHVHHLNYGIFLLSGVGYYLIFARPTGTAMAYAAVVYGVGLGLTFDEFGMWIHLGGSYWQRASFDAVVVVTALLGLIAFAPDFRKLRPQHWLTAFALLVLLFIFAALLAKSVRLAGRHFGPRLVEIERSGPR